MLPAFSVDQAADHGTVHTKLSCDTTLCAIPAFPPLTNFSDLRICEFGLARSLSRVVVSLTNMGARAADMLPTFAEYHPVDDSQTNTVSVRELGLCGSPFGISLSDSENIVISQFCGPITFTSGLAVFSDHIKSVVCVRTNEQVVGVDTRRKIAMMADVFARGDGAAGDLPREPVSSDSPVSLKREGAIPFWETFSHPRPTLRGGADIYGLPKARMGAKVQLHRHTPVGGPVGTASAATGNPYAFNYSMMPEVDKYGIVGKPAMDAARKVLGDR